METRAHASKKTPLYREMGPDHSSDEDYVDVSNARKPARKKSRTQAKHPARQKAKEERLITAGDPRVNGENLATPSPSFARSPTQLRPSDTKWSASLPQLETMANELEDKTPVPVDFGHTPSGGIAMPTVNPSTNADLTDISTRVEPIEVIDPFEGLPADEAPVCLPDVLLFTNEKKPRKRKSDTSDTRTNIAAGHIDVPNHAEMIPQLGYRSWEQLTQALKAYAVGKGFHFRIRSRKPVGRCQRPDMSQIPDRMNDLPAEGSVADKIGVLADAGAGSHQITNYALNALANNSAQERLKEMLHSLKQVEGSEVLLIQDDLDITCGIVLQTRVQKLALKLWGENLTLDFTHGTNNRGFHLALLANVNI
ncbi:Serine protease [Phytophthora megakarya]|uniref:Serine protease n=1 Tax=Phytophthora megakarya TaxID=4795 RepID=A0A225VKI3_9STRA|nr:Serine protease [Phytophthora megakarya]